MWRPVDLPEGNPEKCEAVEEGHSAEGLEDSHEGGLGVLLTAAI